MRKISLTAKILGILAIAFFAALMGANKIMANQNKNFELIQGKIVFESNRDGTISFLKNGEIKTVSKRGGSPKFSQDGQSIFYASGPIYKVDIQHTRAEPLIDLKKYTPEGFDIAPNGEQIVFLSHGENFSHEIPANLFIANIDGSNVKQMTFFTAKGKDAGGAGGAGRPRWSPDGGKVIFTGPDKINFSFIDSALYLINSDGSDLKKIIGSSLMRNVSSPNWFPDSQKIVFHGLKDEGQRFAQIYIANADGSDIKQVTHLDADHQWPVFSPDGKQIAYSSPRRGSKKMGWAIVLNQGAELFAINIDGTDEKRITPPFSVRNGFFPWNVVYAVDQEPDWHA